MNDSDFPQWRYDINIIARWGHEVKNSVFTLFEIGMAVELLTLLEEKGLALPYPEIRPFEEGVLLFWEDDDTTVEDDQVEVTVCDVGDYFIFEVYYHDGGRTYTIDNAADMATLIADSGFIKERY